MDPAQAAQMIAWLDEEARKGKAQMAELRDLLQKQEIELGDQRKRIEDLQGRLNRLQGELSRMTQVDQAIAQVKSELAAVLRDVREELRRDDQQALQMRQIEREADTKALLELSQRVEQLSALQDKLATQETEQRRLNEVLQGLRQRLDGVDKELVRGVERDRLADEDRKRQLGRLDALQQAIDSLRTQTDSYGARFLPLEKWAQDHAQRLAELQTFRADMQRLQGELLEAQRRGEQRIEKQIREWAAVAEAVHHDQELWANQLRVFAEQHERTKKALAAIQDLAKELRMAQSEVRQAVDLAIEKQRRELREWQGENEKRWTRYLAQWEYRWDEQRKVNETLSGQIGELAAAGPLIQQALQELRALLAEQVAAAEAAVLEIWRFQMAIAQQQSDVAKAIVDKFHSRLGE